MHANIPASKQTLWPFVLLLIPFSGAIHAQTWAEDIEKPAANYYQIRKRFDMYWQTHDKNQKGSGYKQFMRWANFVERRVFPSGDLSLLELTAKNFSSYAVAQIAYKSLSASPSWTPVGPMGSQPGDIPFMGPPLMKTGRLSFITISPTNSLHLYVGAPNGGLWQSTNGGSTWVTHTDNLVSPGCTDLVIDPSNQNTLYLATTGILSTPGIGVLKSTDGGQTWNPTGLNTTLHQVQYIRRLLIHPTNPLMLLAGASTGVYRTTDGGVSWSQVSTFNCYDLEFKPGDPNTVYASSSSFYASTNGGASFSATGAGFPTNASRNLISVTPHDPNYVYVINTTAGGVFDGLYRSVNAGATFSLMSATPNIVLGAGYYNLAMAVSPKNKNEIVAGGIILYKSVDGGVTWAMLANGAGPNSTHCDHHDLDYAPDGTIYSVNDGGIYSYPASTQKWTELSGAMNVSQIYRFGLSAITPGKLISGHQDNGTAIRSGTTYTGTLPGDGLDCFFDRTNDQNVFASFQGGNMRRSTDGGLTWSVTANNLSNIAGWPTPWKQDPVNPNIIYIGYNNLYKSTDLGITWSSLANSIGGVVIEFAIAPSNNQVIYTIEGAVINKTTNGGTSWTMITGTLPVNSAAPEALCIDPSDEDHLWVALSGYAAGQKVYETTDGGATWNNVSANLPNIPASSIVFQPGSNDRIYLGMDAGVYYRDNNSNGWVIYNTGLPNTPVTDLEFSPATPSLLYASTYGRGMWMVHALPVATPASSFTIESTPHCSGEAIQFNDLSTESPDSWNWTIAPSAGVVISSPSTANPLITFPAAGVYSVTLQASNPNGAGSMASQTISIAAAPAVSIVPASPTLCSGSSVSFSATGAMSYTWSNNGGTEPTAVFSPVTHTYFTVTGDNLGCLDSAIVQVFVNNCTGESLIERERPGFVAYPNPATDHIIIRANHPVQFPVMAGVTDMAGRSVLYYGPVIFDENDRATLKIDMLPPGSYQLHLTVRNEPGAAIKFNKR